MNSETLRADNWNYLFAAMLVALFSSLAVLFIGEVLGQAPCNLCWFQRAFMFPLAIVLAVGAFLSDSHVWRYALPLAIGGLLVAGFHSLVYSGLVAEAIQPCSATGPSCSGDSMAIFGWLPLPVLSFGAFGLITALLVSTIRRQQ